MDRKALAPLIWLPGLLFEALVRLRGRCYDKGFLKPGKLPRPVISIGNITMGGSGKTPLVIYAAQTAARLGMPPAVLTRGYRRQNPGAMHILAPDESVASPAAILGDEPALIRRHVPGVWLGVGKDRLASGAIIMQQQERPVFILDDGFQHRRLHRDLDIVVIDRSQPLLGNRVFPRGTLREPLSGLRRCRAVVLNGSGGGASTDVSEADIRRLGIQTDVFRCEQKIDRLIPYSAWAGPDGTTAVSENIKTAYLVAAIGNPTRFLRDVQQLGIEVRGTDFYADHHQLSPDEWIACGRKARMQKVDAMITTEKDAIKISCPPDFPLLVSVQSTNFLNPRAFEDFLINYLEGRR
jgi:tetraacyldisaccharide 4'-kinase